MSTIAVIAVLLIAVLLVTLFLARSIQIIPQATQVVVERFGRYSRTLQPGLRLLMPVADTVYVNVVVYCPPTFGNGEGDVLLLPHAASVRTQAVNAMTENLVRKQSPRGVSGTNMPDDPPLCYRATGRAGSRRGAPSGVPPCRGSPSAPAPG